MKNDREIAERVARLKAEARDIPLSQVPGYAEWSEQKLAEGESPALIENLDALTMWLLPEDVATVEVSIYEELLADLKAQMP